MGVDLLGDPHREDDDGFNWARLSDARSAEDIVPGSATVMGSSSGRYLAKVVAWDSRSTTPTQSWLSNYCRSGPARSPSSLSEPEPRSPETNDVGSALGSQSPTWQARALESRPLSVSTSAEPAPS